MRWPVYLVLLACILVLTVSAGCHGRPAAPADGHSPSLNDTGSPVLYPGNDPGSANYLFTLQHGGLRRSYLVHVPPSYSRGIPVPAVLVFHGGGDDIYGQMRQSGITRTSDREGFLAVFPQGTGATIEKKTLGTWNAGRCCGSAKEHTVDDVGFVNALLDDLEEKFSVDPDRVYATGISNGALFTYRLACEIPERIAAIGPVAGQDACDTCRPSRPVSVIHFHGTTDPAALYNGGHCGGRLPGDPGWSCMPVPDYIRTWAELDRCSLNETVTFRNGTATCRTYGSCAGGTEVTLCTIDGGGHTWPGGSYLKDERWWREAVGNLSSDIPANDVMWDFFRNHPRE